MGLLSKPLSHPLNLPMIGKGMNFNQRKQNALSRALSGKAGEAYLSMTVNNEPREPMKTDQNRKCGSFICQKCGCSFVARTDGKHKFCSRKCNAENRRAAHLLEWHKKNDADFGRTRRPRICKGCGKSFVPQTHHDNQYCNRSCVPLAAMLNTDRVKSARISALETYLHTKRLSEQRYNAKRWHLRSPMNVEYHPINLNRFVAKNHELFEDDDLKPIYKDGRCRAAHSLKNLRPSDKRKKQMNTWKGWTWVSIYERRFNDGNDLLDRNPVLAESILTPLHSLQ